MTSKELVEKCNLFEPCKKCHYRDLCDSFYHQFGCYPFDVKMNYKAPPEANLDTEIQFP